MVLQHQAKELGIEPLDSQIKRTAIMALPAFPNRTGQFDPRKVRRDSSRSASGPNGLTGGFH